MQKGHTLQFSCQNCKQSVRFSIFELEAHDSLVACPHCPKKYCFNDQTLSRQLKKFEALCRQIHESEEILGNTAVGITVGEHQVKIPYKLLLTRLSSSMDLLIGSEPISVIFRMEPAKDMPAISSK